MGRSHVRLDCVEHNLRLRDYYRQAGFSEVGRKDVDEPWLPVTLLEKRLIPQPERVAASPGATPEQLTRVGIPHHCPIPHCRSEVFLFREVFTMRTSTHTGDVPRVAAALRGILPVRASIRSGRGATAWVTANGERLSARWIGEGRLPAVRELVAATDRPDIVVGRVLSPGARAALSKAGIGWVDETGAAEIATPSIIVSRSGQVPAPRERSARWTSSVLSVAEALLCETPATVAATTAASGLSEGACTNALRTLTVLGLLSADAQRGRASARRVVDPRALLDAYADAATANERPVALTVGVTWQDPIDGLVQLGHNLDKLGVTWAATGSVASAVVAPLITSISASEIYVDAPTQIGLEVVAANLGLRPIEGGRLTLRPFPTRATSRLATRERDLNVVPWPRLYADLRNQGVRGEDAAEHLRETIHER